MSSDDKGHTEQNTFNLVSIKGSRGEQEDGSNVHVSHINGDKSQLLKFFCVHDGHRGSQAVDTLKSMAGEFWKEIKNGEKLNLNPPNDVQDDENVTLLADLYKNAHTQVEKEVSGVVSITALSIKNSALYFSWIGDCEGCLFFKEPSLSSPTKDHMYHVPIDHVNTVDFAVKELGEPDTEIPPSTHIPACSAPHSLMSGMQDKAKFPREPPHPSHPRVRHTFHEKEEYIKYNHVIPKKFPNLISKREFELAKLQNKEIRTTMFVEIHKVGNAVLTDDARFSGNIQPTRSIGDFGHSVLRHPTVMRMLFPDPLPPDLKEHGYILLCCDGFFSNYAFSGLSALCRFLADPDAFFSESFYCRGQVLTERLIATRWLPPNLEKVKDVSQFPLYQKWKNCTTWDEKCNFILNEHMKAVQSDQFNAVFSDDDHLYDHRKWIAACKTSMFYVQSVWGLGLHTLMAHSIAPHMAVFMGSMDNVTLVMTKAFK